MKSTLSAARLLAGIGREIGVAVCVFYLFVSGTAFISPLLLALGVRPLVDGAVAHENGQIVAGAVLAGCGLLLTVLSPIGYRWATIRMRERSVLVVQRRMVRLSSAAPRLEHFERPEYWDRMQLLRRGTEDLANGIALVLVGPLLLVQLVVAAISLAQFQPLLCLVPLVALPTIQLSKRSERLRRSAEERAAESRRLANHLFNLASSTASASEIRLYGLRETLLDRHEAATRTVRAETERALLAATAANALSWLIFAGAYAVAIFVSLREAIRGQASPGDVALTMTMAGAVVAGAARLSDLIGSLGRVSAAAGHYRWLEDQARDGHPGGARPEPATAAPRALASGIALEDVTFRYGSGAPALDGVSLRLLAGSVVAVVGENGAGKTTLVKMLTGMYRPSLGRVSVEGSDLAELDLADFRMHTTAGFQDHTRFEFSVARTVGLGDLPRIDDAQAVSHALGKAGAGFAHELPRGLETRLGTSWTDGVDLSGGQWQKLAMARSLMRPEAYLAVYDEPAAALDPQSEHRLFEQISAGAEQGRAQGRITVLVTHRFSTVRMADLIVVLDRGRVTEQGTHEELISAGGLYAELYEMQAAAYR